MSHDIASRIKRAEKVTEVFGQWPAFHDAEIEAIAFDSDGPAITATIYGFEITNETTSLGYLRLTNHSLVTLRFTGARNISMADFAASNPLMEIDLEYLDEPEGRPRWSVRFEGHTRFYLGFDCDEVEVLSVAPTTVDPPTVSADEMRANAGRRRAAMKRPALAEQVESVSDRATFMEFVESLIDDRKHAVAIGEGDWNNDTISEYLAGALASAREWIPHKTWGLREEPSWHDFAWFLLVGRN